MNKVLIIGRPNVGKSSLFNRLIRKKSALVLNQPGVTRDLLKKQSSWWGVDFEVWDSGGLWSEESAWGPLIDAKIKKAIQDSDLILFVMSAKPGFLDEDKKTFLLIKKSGKPFLALVNKVDSVENTELLLSDFYSLGVPLISCAFEQGKGVCEIVEWIISYGNKKHKKIEPASVIKLLLSGKTNVGKSTLCNALLNQERSLVSPVPGTTVDVVADHFKHGLQNYLILDTAGKVKSKNKVQSLAYFKTEQNFKQADVILLLIDCKKGPSREDARLINFCIEEHKSLIIVVNKWDLSSLSKKPVSKPEYRKNIQDKFRFYPDLPVVFVSALKREGLGMLMKKINEIYKKTSFRVSTSELNRFFMDVIRKAPSPVYGTQDVKFYYLTQTQHKPPAFIAFANYPKGVKNSYRRFLVRQIQNKWNLKGIPIRIKVIPKA